MRIFMICVGVATVAIAAANASDLGFLQTAVIALCGGFLIGVNS